MQVTTKNGIQAEVKVTLVSKYGEEFVSCSVPGKTYEEGEVWVQSEDIKIIITGDDSENLIIAVNSESTIVDCEIWDWDDRAVGDFHEALSAICERHGFES